MKQQALSRRLPALFALVLLAVGVGPAEAQKQTLPESATVVKRDQKWWTSQLRLAREYGRKALIGFQNAPTDEGAPIDEAVHQAARDTYVLIRAARYGIEGSVSDDKWHDPLLAITARKVNEAWQLSRYPVDKASSSMARQEYLERAVHDLGQSMRLLDQVLITLP
jgi:hypothetical protein